MASKLYNVKHGWAEASSSEWAKKLETRLGTIPSATRWHRRGRRQPAVLVETMTSTKSRVRSRLNRSSPKGLFERWSGS